VVRQLGMRFDEIFEIELRLDCSLLFERGGAVLISEKGEKIYREAMDPQRLHNGAYSILA
jgi:hypothetical protein